MGIDGDTARMPKEEERSASGPEANEVLHCPKWWRGSIPEPGSSSTRVTFVWFRFWYIARIDHMTFLE